MDGGLTLLSPAPESERLPGRLRAALESFLPCCASPEPLALTGRQIEWLRRLGPCLLSFYKAKDRLYRLSAERQAPSWIAGYLDDGKPEALVAIGRARAFHDQLPAIIRPDVLLTAEGFVICELDSVPGGFGLTAQLADTYVRSGHPIAGDVSIGDGFIKAMTVSGGAEEGAIAIVVSEESTDYFAEMDWLAGKLRSEGHLVYATRPRSLRYTEAGVTLSLDGREVQIRTVYRFMELFDLPNVSKSELLLYLAKGKRVFMTPPPKAYLEEKMWFAFFHHPALQDYWLRALGAEHMEMLRNALPRTWIIDPAPLPGQAVIPDLLIDGLPVQNWEAVQQAGKAGRRLVAKPSGFSELAWGSRGVVVGHDESAAGWSDAIDRAVRSFPRPSWILQEYRGPDRRPMRRYDPSGDGVVTFDGRVRLTPFYFVSIDEATLSTILATICPSDKKKIHGMRDSVMTICSQFRDEGLAAPF